MTKTYRQLVEDLPASFDIAIDDATQSAYERGFREEGDDYGEAFWAEVYSIVTAA